MGNRKPKDPTRRYKLLTTAPPKVRCLRIERINMPEIRHQSSEIAQAGYRLFTTEQLSQWPTVEWIVDGVIQRETSVVMFGQSRTGKSFLALDLASKIASGENWFGHQVTQSRVIYIPSEGIRGVSNRAKAIEQMQGKPIGENLMFIHALIDIGKADDIQKIIDTGYKKTDVLIVDTFNAVTPGSDENSSKDMGNILYGLRQIIAECHCTLILVHHTGWEDKDRMRGHSSLSAAADTRIHVKQVGGYRQWAVTGQRDGEVTAPKRFQLDPIELDEEKTISCVVMPIQDTPAGNGMNSELGLPIGENQRLTRELAKKLFDENDKKPFELNLLLSTASMSINAQPKHKRTRAKEAVDDLIKKGLLSIENDSVTNVT